MTLKIFRILKFGEKYYHLGALKSLVCCNSHRPDGVKLLSGRYKNLPAKPCGMAHLIHVLSWIQATDEWLMHRVLVHFFFHFRLLKFPAFTI